MFCILNYVCYILRTSDKPRPKPGEEGYDPYDFEEDTGNIYFFF